MRRLALLFLLLFVAPPVLAAHPQPIYREIKDWVVACDNTARCEAIGANEVSPLMMRLVAEAGPDGALTLALESGRDLDPARLRLDGRSLWLDARGWEQRAEEGYSTLVVQDAANVRRLLAQIRNGAELSVGDGDEAADVSLSGLSAVLLAIDEAQGRLGTMTALLRTGTRPASQVPAASAPPPAPPAAPVPKALGDADRQRLIDGVRTAQSAQLEKEECFVEAEDAYDDAVALDADEALVFVECWRGAYQSSSLLFRTPIAAPARAQRIGLPLPVAIDGKIHRADAFTSAAYSPEQAMLFHSAKGRGLADCGESATWIFDGHDFRLSDFHYLGVCRGGNPGDWLTLWRSATAP